MKYLLTIIWLLAVLSLDAATTNNTENNMTKNQLIICMVMAESTGKPNQVNHESGAVGPLGIKQILLDDINEKLELQLELSDCERLSAAIYIFNIYQGFYAPHDATCRDMAGIWKSGPTGYRQDPEASDIYWKTIVHFYNALMVADRNR